MSSGSEQLNLIKRERVKEVMEYENCAWCDKKIAIPAYKLQFYDACSRLHYIAHHVDKWKYQSDELPRIDAAGRRVLWGKRIVRIGLLRYLRPRDVEAALANLGARRQNTVQWNTHFVVVGERPPLSGLNTLSSVGAPVITERQLLSMIVGVDNFSPVDQTGVDDLTFIQNLERVGAQGLASTQILTSAQTLRTRNEQARAKAEAALAKTEEDKDERKDKLTARTQPAKSLLDSLADISRMPVIPNSDPVASGGFVAPVDATYTAEITNIEYAPDGTINISGIRKVPNSDVDSDVAGNPVRKTVKKEKPAKPKLRKGDELKIGRKRIIDLELDDDNDDDENDADDDE